MWLHDRRRGSSWLVVVLVIYLIALYNGLVQKRNRVDNSWAQIEVQLKRRHDLIPNLVETVKGYAAHERGTFEAVTQARAAAMGAQGPAQAAAAEGILGQALGRLFAVAEAYPDLKASTNFLDLQTAASGHREQGRRLAPGLQRHGADVQQRDPGVPRRADRRPVRLHEARVLRGRGRRRPRGADGQLPAGRPGSPGPSLRQLPPPAMRLRRRATLALSLAAALAALAIAGTRRREVVPLPQADDLGAGGEGRQPRSSTSTSPTRSRGPFSGGYRDIPLRERRVDRRRARERGRPRLPSRRLHRARLHRRAGTFGTADVGDQLRIVWHYRRSDELRTFTVHYRLRGRRGRLRRRRRRQPQGLGLRVGASRSAASPRPRSRPGRSSRAWGHPVYVRGDVQLAGAKVLLRALDVPAGQFVELRTVIPRGRVHLDRRDAGRRPATASRRSSPRRRPTPPRSRRDHERIENAKQHPWRYAALPAPARARSRRSSSSRAVFWFYGRELKTGYDREYEQEPPTETEPALVPTLLRQGGEAGSFEFTATLFDLIRRGVYTSTPVTTERSIWGGLRTESVSDLELSPGKHDEQLTPVGERGRATSSTA